MGKEFDFFNSPEKYSFTRDELISIGETYQELIWSGVLVLHYQGKDGLQVSAQDLTDDQSRLILVHNKFFPLFDDTRANDFFEQLIIDKEATIAQMHPLAEDLYKRNVFLRYLSTEVADFLPQTPSEGNA